MKQKRRIRKTPLAKKKSMGQLGDLLKDVDFKDVSNGEETPLSSPEPEALQNGRSSQVTIPSDARIRIHRERKGRGGKAVTIIEGHTLSGTSLTSFLKQMKKALGCGAHLESTHIVLQGDMVERVAKWLEHCQKIQ